MSGNTHDADSDDALVARLGRLFTTADPVPEAVVSGARASLGWRSLDADLASLVADSLQATGDVRGSTARLLTFEAGQVALEIEVSQVGNRLRVVGQIVPPGPAQVRAEQPGSTVDTATDEWGRFALPGLAAGPARFAWTVAGAGAVTVRTAWALL